MNLIYIIKAAETMEAKAVEAERFGNHAAAAEFRNMAVKKYQEAAKLCPQKSGMYLSLAREVIERNRISIKADEQERPLNKKLDSSVEKESHDESRDKTEDTITFEDVAGLEDVKNDIRLRIIEPMRNPHMAEQFRIKPGAKILLYGPPGTGKTFIAKAIAGEIDAKFYAVNCQDLISKYMGESSKKLDELFDSALGNEKAIIFFDEFDSVASKRGDGSQGADGEMARFVATFLTKVDGFKKSQTNKMLLLIAATNRPWTIDDAMLRGGRFDTHIYVGVPDQSAREFLVNKVLKGLPMDDDVVIADIAHKLEGYGGGDITAICEKIKLGAYMRSIKVGSVQNITKEDCDATISNSRNIIKEDDLEKFVRFRSYGKIC